MLKTQIQLPEPLFNQLKRIAEQRDWSLAELVRRGTRFYPSFAAKKSMVRLQASLAAAGL